jgi:acyl-CoA synthetase (AMP-forming)/AMP-acid ligase II
LPSYRDFIELIRSLENAPSSRGIHLISSRFQESFHPYAVLYRRILTLAHQFRSQGVSRGDRVLIPLESGVDAFGSFLALVYLGAVPFSVQAPLIGQDREAHRRQMARLFTRHRVSRVLVAADLADLVGSSSEVPSEAALTLRPSTDAELESPPPPLEPAPVDPDDVVFVQFSSGSTSQPKGVRITHRGLIYNLNLIADNDRRTGESVWVSWLPLYHDMGLVGGLFTNLLHKNSLVLMHPRCFMTRPISWLSAITRHRGTVTAIPNFALDICSERVTEEQLDEHGIDLSTFRYVYNGSEPVRIGSIRRFEQRFVRRGYVPGSIYPVYGMAETTLIVSAPRFGQPETQRHVEGMRIPSVGYPLGDFEIEIRAEDGTVLVPGSVGEIHIRGTSVTPGYLAEGESEYGTIRDGWLATGDLGILDEDGRLYITGRRKDLIIVQGRNFYGHDIAARIEEDLTLRGGSVYVFSMEGERGEQVVAMIATPKSRGDDPAPPIDPARLLGEVQRVVMREFGLVVEDLLMVQRIPKTTSGKISRHVCQRMYLEARRGEAGA